MLGLVVPNPQHWLAGNSAIAWVNSRYTGNAWDSTAYLGIANLALLVFVAPLPLYTRSEGVVWLPERSNVRAGTQGFVVDGIGRSGGGRHGSSGSKRRRRRRAMVPSARRRCNSSSVSQRISEGPVG